MKIEALGHSCFLMTTEKGTRILTDPFDGGIGYEEPAVETEIVTMSHGHYDHHKADAPKNAKLSLDTVTQAEYADVKIYGVATCHDEQGGALRGPNIVYVFEADGLRVAHLGDLGHLPTKEQIEKIGKLDVLMIPVGGIFTLDAKAAQETVKLLDPRVVIPMHYQTKRLTLGKRIGKLEAFTKRFSNVTYAEEKQIRILPGDGQKGVIVPVLPE